MEINREWPRWCINKKTKGQMVVSSEDELYGLREDGWVTRDEYYGIKPEVAQPPPPPVVVSPKGDKPKGRKPKAQEADDDTISEDIQTDALGGGVSPKENASPNEQGKELF